MLPVVAGEVATRRQILAYAVILLPVAVAPYWIGGAGEIYAIAAAVLSLVFIALCVPVFARRTGEDDRMKPEKRLFSYSVFYLFAVFAGLVADRLILGQGSLA
jgi:protoheme IX farnesyltransferase